MLRQFFVGKKLNQVIFLILMLSFVSLITYISMGYRSNANGTVTGSVATTSPNADDLNNGSPILFSNESISQQIQINPKEAEPILSTIETNFELLDDGGAVLAANSSCEPNEDCGKDLIAYQPVCSKGDVNFSTAGEGSIGTDNGSGSISVSKNASLRIVKVTSPLPILSGSEQIDTTAYAISYEHPNFYSGVKQVREAVVGAKYVSPGAQKRELVEAAEGADTDEFTIHASLTWGQGNPSEETILRELDSMCPEVQPSDPNPDPSNKVTEQVMGAYAVPGKRIEPRDYGTPDCIEVSGIDLPEAEIYETCTAEVGIFSGVINTVIQAQKWTECLTNPGACTQVEIVGILIDAIYGANHKCNDGFCTDQFLDYSLASTLSPNDITSWKDDIGAPGDPTIRAHYVTTPCKVEVIDRVHNGIYDIPCIWDLSPYKAQYDLQVNFRKPGDPILPSWEEYWDLVMQEAKERGGFCGA